MKLYKTKGGIVIKKDDSYYLVEDHDWDTYINDDELYAKVERATKR